MAARAEAKRSRTTTQNGDGELSGRDLQVLLRALQAARDGDFSVRLPGRRAGVVGEVSDAFNKLVAQQEQLTRELARVSRTIGREGRMTERAALPGGRAGWTASVEAVNSMIDDLVRPTTEVARVLGAVAEGDLSQKMPLAIEEATRVITNATSLGGVESLLETRARWEGDRVPPNLLRLSVGLEDIDDLWAYLTQALEHA